MITHGLTFVKIYDKEITHPPHWMISLGDHKVDTSVEPYDLFQKNVRTYRRVN